MQSVQYAVPCTDARASAGTPEALEAANERQILNATTLVRCQRGADEADEDNAAELLVLPSDPLPGHRIVIVPLPERSIGIVPHARRLGLHTINNLPMGDKRIAVYSYVR